MSIDDFMPDRLTVQDLQLPDDDIARLRAFFGISAEDEERLQVLKGLFGAVEKEVVERFFEHVLDEPEMKKFFREPQVLERAKQAQLRMLQQLVSGEYGREYAEDRLELGAAHSSQNIPPKWLIGGFSYFLGMLLSELKHDETITEEKIDHVISIAKMLFFDLALEIESFTIGRSRQLNKILLQVAEAEEFTRSTLDAASNLAIYAITADGEIQSWNKGAENLLGYKDHEARSLSFRMLYADVASVEGQLTKVAMLGTIEHHAWMVRKDGTRFYGRISTAPLRDDMQRVKGYVEIIQDETVAQQARERLESQRKEIANVAKVLSEVTSQVSQVAAALSSATADSVAAITQTTATSDQVRQTAEQTSVKAKSVSDDAKNVLHVSRQGQEATDNTIKGMVHIREQMESIADCMAQLTNQSRLIGDIIAFVDDLAQQSNLLAVNASIEAAKAGEQGKGFAVVAQEVKNLSQQSKKATAHIRSILNDVMRATTAATAATEQGSRAVEQGHQQAFGAGQVIKALTESIDKAAQATELIEISSQQQLVGMKQVVNAMESIRELSGNNLESARQLDVAGKQLSELGKHMVELTSKEVESQA